MNGEARRLVQYRAAGSSAAGQLAVAQPSVLYMYGSVPTAFFPSSLSASSSSSAQYSGHSCLSLVKHSRSRISTEKAANLCSGVFPGEERGFVPKIHTIKEINAEVMTLDYFSSTLCINSMKRGQIQGVVLF